MRLSSTIGAIGLAGQALAQASAGNVIYQLSPDGEFAFVLEEYLALSSGGGSATGEVLRVANQLVPGDFESWYKEWTFMADAMHEKAVAIDSTKLPISARDTYFRAASYYRAADFFLHANQSDPRIQETGAAGLADFDKAVSLLEVPVTVTNLKGPGFDIPIYFYPAKPAAPESGIPCPPAPVPPHPNCSSPNHTPPTTTRFPTVIIGSGYDGSQQALYHSIALFAVERGYNVITYEGPGQPTPRRTQGLGFIPNWWDVVTPVVDYLHTLPSVDTSHIALIGLSFGGILAPRAASKEKRISAVVAIDGINDMQAALRAQFPASLMKLYDSGNKAVFDEYMLDAMHNTTNPSNFRWVIAQGLYSFATESPFEWFKRLGQITALNDTLEDVDVPMLVFGAEDDIVPQSQALDVMKGLKEGLGTFYEFKNEYGAGQHCQLGAEGQLSQAVFDWLSGIWGQSG